MAEVAVMFSYASGEDLEIHVVVDESYPDAVAEARAQAMTTFREAYALLSDKSDQGTE